MPSRPIDPKNEFARLANALRSRGHPDLATQLWLALRYPHSAVLRGIIGRKVEGMGGAG